MTNIDSTYPGALGIAGQAFWGQESVGLGGGLVERFLRSMPGDPAGYIQILGIPTTPAVGLPDLPGVKAALLYVGLSTINIRVDGGVPVAGNDLAVVAGSYIWLTGVPSIKGFQAVAQAGTAAIFGCYFT